MKLKTLVLIFALTFLIFHFGKTTLRILKSGERMKRLQEEVSLLEEEGRTLEEESLRVQKDSFIEKVAREKLEMIFPGERIVLLPEKEVLGVAMGEREERKPDGRPNWKKWRELFFE